MEPSSSALQAPLDSPIPGPSNLEPPNSPIADACILEPPSSPIADACILEPPSSPIADACILEPPSSPIPDACILEPPSSPIPDACILEPPSSPIADACILEPPSSPIPDACILEPPSSPIPDACILEPPSSPIPDACILEPPSSPIADACILEPPSSPIADACILEPPSSPIPDACILEPPSSPIADACILEPPSSPIPDACILEPPSSPIPDACILEPPSSPIPDACILEPPSSPIADACILEPPSSPTPATCILEPPSSPTLPQRDIGTSVTPVPTAATSTRVTPVHTAATATGTSITPVPTAATGTSITPVPTAATGTSITPVHTAAIGTSITPVHTAATSTSITPVHTAATGTSITPVHTAAIGTSVTPVHTAATGTSITPVHTAAIGTFMTPRYLRESSINTSTGPPPCAKDSAAETDSLLWLCPREQMKSLPRAELEGRLASALIIIEALSLQLRDWNENQRSLPGVGPAEQREALTQTDVTYPEGEEIYCNLYLELRRRMDALQRQRGREQDLHQQLQMAVEHMHAWDRQRPVFQDLVDTCSQSLQDERRTLVQQQEQVSTLVSRCQALLERVPSKLQSCLEELDAMRQQVDEALQAKQEASHQLEETSVALQDTVAKLEQLTVANSCLRADHSSLVTSLASLEQERDALRQENEKQQEEMASLALEREVLQRERDGLCQELREATECREFLEQENQTSCTQLQEVEARLRSTLDTLQEERQQHKELMDSHQRLREKQAALSKELESTKAELLDMQCKRNKISWCSKDIVENKMRLQELAECLRAALQEEDDAAAAPLKSRTWTPVTRTRGWQTPYRVRTPACHTPMFQTPRCATGSFSVASVLKAVSGEDADEAAGAGSALTKDKLAATPKAIEPEDDLLDSVKQLKSVVSDLAMLSYRVQDREQSNFKALRTEISNLQLRLETVTTESEEKINAQAATIAKLNKTLTGKLKMEKELQDAVNQQEKKMLQHIDQSAEISRLKEEIRDLKRSQQHAETEAKVLWKEMREQRPKEDTVHVQDRVLQQQELNRLRLLLMERVQENLRLADNVQWLEVQLNSVQRALRSHEEMQKKMKEVLVAVPDTALVFQEHHSLLQYLGLKPESVCKDALEPQ
ncbi:sperm-associated antigen 5 [Melopsittacus undulatus]|uniref:sperm-associated antigen 5 n=1 Tax=Melopsittacus undulatus TaxID=13146 RepID=UPI00146C31D7|nr:centrosome-associated protein CEP250-like [Melopsittacus undulatus]